MDIKIVYSSPYIPNWDFTLFYKAQYMSISCFTKLRRFWALSWFLTSFFQDTDNMRCNFEMHYNKYDIRYLKFRNSANLTKLCYKSLKLKIFTNIYANTFLIFKTFQNNLINYLFILIAMHNFKAWSPVIYTLELKTPKITFSSFKVLEAYFCY